MIYIHIPFCKSRCLYCDFFSSTANARKDEFVRALKQEMKGRAAELLHARANTIFISKLLEGADVELRCDFFFNREYWEDVADKIVYTGELDRYFDYCYGHLEYRTLRFKHEQLNIPDYQGVAVMNFTDRQTPYTRIVEHRHFDSSCTAERTVITREYPSEWHPGAEPYYPIGDAKNSELAEKYRTLAAKSDTIFGGRLAEYRYYDMHHIVAKALKIEL